MRKESNMLLFIWFFFFTRRSLGGILVISRGGSGHSPPEFQHQMLQSVSQPLGLKRAIKEAAQAINGSSCEPDCTVAALGDVSDINESMIDHTWAD